MEPVFRSIADASLAAEYRARGWWGDVTLADIVAHWAEERGDAPAFVTDRVQCSWRAYDAASDELAAVAGVAFDEGARVAVWLPDGATVHIAYLAAEKAGVTVVGIGSRAGDHEVAHLLETTDAGRGDAAEHRGRDMRTAPLGDRADVIVPDFEGGPVAAFAEVPAAAPAAGRRPVHAQLDVGHHRDCRSASSTRRTGGCTSTSWRSRRASSTGDDVFLSVMPAPFGFGLWTAHFTPTLLGAPTVLPERFDADAALELIERAPGHGARAASARSSS